MTIAGSRHLRTLAVTAGRDSSPGAPLNVPPTFASTYRDGGAVGYGRWGNPTWSALEEALGAAERGKTVAFASGQAAIAALIDPLKIGAVITLPVDAYLGTRSLLRDLDARGRVKLQPIDVTVTDDVIAALAWTDLLWLESPTNPMLGIVDLPAVLAAARANRVATVVDNTMATPVVQQPLALGASAVLHSATKYIGGHSDLLLGAVVTADEEHRAAMIEHRTMHGAVPGVMEAFLALRGLRTLPVRFAQQQQTAHDLAQRLRKHPRVLRVRYPGLDDDPHYERACAYMSGFGAIVSFEVENAGEADLLTSALQLIVGGTSFGGVESTIDRRQRWPGEEAVPAGLLRLSVGLEHVDDLWRDLEQALDGT